jgi:hypothetical protein
MRGKNLTTRFGFKEEEHGEYCGQAKEDKKKKKK